MLKSIYVMLTHNTRFVLFQYFYKFLHNLLMTLIYTNVNHEFFVTQQMLN